MSEETIDKVKFNLEGYDAFTRTVGKNGNSAYVQIPRKYVGLEVVIVVREKPDKNPETKPRNPEKNRLNGFD